MPVRVTTQPAIEPISIGEAKAHLRVLDGSEDAVISRYLKGARQLVERWEWHSLITQTLTLTIDEFPAFDGPIWLPYGPVQSVTSVKYYDVNGEQQTLTVETDYVLDASGDGPGRVVPAPDECWPQTQCQKINAVEVIYVAGYGDDASDVPADTQTAILLTLGHVYRNREAVSALMLHEVPMAVDAFLRRCHDERVLPFV